MTYSKLTIETLERRRIFEYISDLVLVFLLLTLNTSMPTGSGCTILEGKCRPDIPEDVNLVTTNIPSYRNQSVDLFCKSTNWFQCDQNIGRYKVNVFIQMLEFRCAFPTETIRLSEVMKMSVWPVLLFPLNTYIAL